MHSEAKKKNRIFRNLEKKVLYIGRIEVITNLLQTYEDISPFVLIALTEVFDGIIPFPWNPYLKTDGTSLLILFLVKNFEEKETEFFERTYVKWW